MKNLVKDKYNQFYKSIGFERSGLFKLIKDEFNPETVIYPGCSLHVTPSFYFQHVVYIDKSHQSAEFFGYTNDVSDLISQSKNYKESSYWKFLSKDFQLNLGLKEGSYDLLISIFSGKLIPYCEKYVKENGLVLTNNLFSDNESVKERDDWKLVGLIKCRNFKYYIDYEIKSVKQKQSSLRQNNKGFNFIDRQTYFIYQKTLKNNTINRKIESTESI